MKSILYFTLCNFNFYHIGYLNILYFHFNHAILYANVRYIRRLNIATGLHSTIYAATRFQRLDGIVFLTGIFRLFSYTIFIEAKFSFLLEIFYRYASVVYAMTL